MAGFLVVGSLVLFAAALVLALCDRPGFGYGNQAFTRRARQRRLLITLVRGRDFFERGERPGGR